MFLCIVISILCIVFDMLNIIHDYAIACVTHEKRSNYHVRFIKKHESTCSIFYKVPYEGEETTQLSLDQVEMVI